MALTLTKTSFHGRRQGPLVVVVMDGVGLGPDYAGNAVQSAPSRPRQADGDLPVDPARRHAPRWACPSDADMGNSEVATTPRRRPGLDQGAKLVAEAIASAPSSRARAGARSSPTLLERRSTCT